jgi:Tfp pilus assembly protein PilF
LLVGVLRPNPKDIGETFAERFRRYMKAIGWARAMAWSCSASHNEPLEPRQPSVLLALGVARQLNGEYAAAIDALRLALEIDPDFAAAYNTLAMTQKRMGANENAAHNYDEGS